MVKTLEPHEEVSPTRDRKMYLPMQAIRLSFVCSVMIRAHGPTTPKSLPPLCTHSHYQITLHILLPYLQAIAYVHIATILDYQQYSTNFIIINAIQFNVT
jgi:hypothetical protein